MSEEKRAQWGSSFGFFMAAAGSAIGLGNLWKFPYMAGRNGGGAFLLIYLVFVILVGMPILMAELAIGRHTRLNPIGAFNKLDKRFKFVGILGVLSGVIIPCYYSVVGGWVLAYIFRFITYITDGFPADTAATFGGFISNPWEPLVWSTLFLLATVAVIWVGVEKGIERVSKILMPLLFILLIVMILRSVTLPGASAGLKFLLLPDLDNFTLSGVMDAMGQMFWSMSLGMGIMVTYGSYMRKSTSLVQSAFIIPILDTMAAFLAGLCILPAVFAFNIEPSAGPSLTFITLPAIFSKMPLGIFFGVVFFVLLLVAALTSNISLCEVGVGYLIDRYKMHRRKATILITIFTFAVSIPCSLSMGILSDAKVLGWLAHGPFKDFSLFNMGFFDFCDYLTQNVFMMIAGLFTCIFIGYSWGVDNALKEITNDGEIQFRHAGAWRFLIKYVSPIFMIIVLLRSTGIITMLFGI